MPPAPLEASLALCRVDGGLLNLPVLILVGASVLVCGLAGLVTRRRDFPGRRSFVLLQLAMLWWMLAAAGELAFGAAGCKLAWAQLAWPGIIATPTCWAVFLWHYLNSHQRSLARRSVLALSLPVLLIWLLVLSNGWHQQVYTAATQASSPAKGAALAYVHGPLFYLIAAYVYALMGFAVLLGWRALRQAPPAYRRHYRGFVLMTCLPWLANAAYVLFDLTLFGFDPTPFSFMLTSLHFSWLIRRRQLFDLVPIARHMLLERLPDPVLVIDLAQRIVEANQAAYRLARPASQLEGLPLGACPVLGSGLLALLGGQGGLLELPAQARYFELDTVVLDQGEGPLGQLLLLRDVSQHHLAQLQLAAALTALESQLAHTSALQARLQEQALRDPLTGLFNRRYLEEIFPGLLARAEREGSPLALVMIDIDHFKQLNDQLGHLAGDAVLVSLAHQLRQAVRESDLVFRYGGEEFLLLMPGAELEAARQRSEALRQHLLTHPLDAGPALPAQTLTLSAGVAARPQHGASLARLLAAADQALYAAKRAGRNQVQLAPA